MWSSEDETHLKDLALNTLLILDLQMIKKSMSNNYISEGFGIQRSEDNLLKV
jgi:hypothetical protein